MADEEWISDETLARVKVGDIFVMHLCSIYSCASGVTFFAVDSFTKSGAPRLCLIETETTTDTNTYDTDNWHGEKEGTERPKLPIVAKEAPFALRRTKDGVYVNRKNPAYFYEPNRVYKWRVWHSHN